MGVNLHMKIGKRNFNLGRSHRYKNCMEPTLDTDLENLYAKKQFETEDLEKRIIAMAAHHPTKEELQEFCNEIADMVASYADEMERIGRCLTLADIKECDDSIVFEVK